MGQKMFKIGPDVGAFKRSSFLFYILPKFKNQFVTFQYIDEDYVECTPVPLYEQNIPMFDYGSYLDKQPDDIIKIVLGTEINPFMPLLHDIFYVFSNQLGPKHSVLCSPFTRKEVQH